MTSPDAVADACSAQTATEDGGQAARRTTAVRKLQLLNLPKLLDVCSLYGADNPQLVQQLVVQVPSWKPFDAYLSNLSHLVLQLRADDTTRRSRSIFPWATLEAAATL